MDRIEATEQTRSSEPLLSLWLLSSLVPELGRELQDIALGPAGQQCEDVAEVSPRLNVVALAAGDQHGGDSVPFSAIIAAAEGPIVAFMQSFS